MAGIEDQQPELQDSFDSNLEICYEVLLYLSSRLARLKPGQVFEFVTGDRTAIDKIPGWCDERGYTLLENEVMSDGRLRFLIQR